MGHIRVDLSNTNNKWVEFGLVNVDTFIIRVGFGLANVDRICTLTQHEHDPSTRIVTPIHSLFLLWVATNISSRSLMIIPIMVLSSSFVRSMALWRLS